MKKILSLIIMLFYCSTNSSFAMSELYYLKNIKTDSIKPYVEENIINHGFNIIKQNPYYAVSQTNNDTAVIILQQSGENMFYYYQSNSNKINKAILKEIKKRNIVCEQSFNTNILGIYDNLASETIKSAGAVKQYSFEEPENIFTPPQKAQTYLQPNTYKGAVVQLGTGTKFQAYLQNAINTATASKGDQIVAVLTENLNYNGAIIAPQGSLLYGTLTTARNATYGSRNGRVVISFTTLVTPENKTYNISTEAIDFTVSNEGKIGESAKNALGSAAVGAVAGLLFALLADKNVGQAMAIGAGVGAGTSVVKSTAERGVDAEIPSFTEIEVTLTKPLSVSVSY